MPSTAGMAALATGLYIVAATAALVRAFSTRGDGRSGNFGLWFGAAILLSLAAASRLLDGHVILASFVHHQMTGLEWYEWRHFVQMPALILAGILTGIGVTYALNSQAVSRTDEKVAFASLLLLILLVAVRTLSLHAIDAFLGVELGQFKVVWLLEAGLLIAFILSILLTNLPSTAVKR